MLRFLSTIDYSQELFLGNLKYYSQENYSERKSAHILVKLYPYLQNASADGRRDI